jgi:hypothetical protein
VPLTDDVGSEGIPCASGQRWPRVDVFVTGAAAKCHGPWCCVM